MHPAAFNWASSLIREKTFLGVVEFGARNVNGSIRPHVQHSFAYTGVDVKTGPGVDVVQDAADYRSDPVGLVICMETLEHAPNWDAIVLSASENLLPGGWFVMTCAGLGRAPHSAIDGGSLRPGEYYQNIDAELFRQSAVDAGLEIKQLEHRPREGDLYALAIKPTKT